MPTAQLPDNSGALFNKIKEKYRLASEGDLAEFIGTNRSIVSEIRHGKRVIPDVMLVRICDATGMTLKAARKLIAES